MSARTQGLRDLIDQAIRAHLPIDPFRRRKFIELLQFVRAESYLLSPQSYRHARSDDQIAERIRALLRVSMVSSRWIRSIEGWQCDREKIRSLDEQFHSLLRFLLAKYYVPRFMNHVWHGSSVSGCDQGIEIFLKMARGIGPRQCGLPVSLTKSQAAQFMTAPDDLNLMEAIRWSQVLAMGGSSKLARTVSKTHLCDQQDDEPFWMQSIQWFCRIERERFAVLSDEEIVQIIQFVRQHRFEPASRVLGYPTELDQPLQPNLELRGRSVRSLRRLMANWRQQIDVPEPLVPTRGYRKSSWQSIGINGMNVNIGQEVWTIEELLTGHELQVEGGIMQHCVGEYDRDCLRGESSIWSVRVSRKGKRKRVLTMELCPQRREILQAKGKCNLAPTVAVQKLVRHWAQRENVMWRN